MSGDRDEKWEEISIGPRRGRKSESLCVRLLQFSDVIKSRERAV